ncbi:MAG: phosphatase PAP2 family protein [Pseudomarimonas sp.]
MNARSLYQRDADICLACNRWGRHARIQPIFATVSRLGDGAIWYWLMTMVVLADGWHGLAASTHMAATGLAALLLYTWLKRYTRRPRPFAEDRRIHALARPLDQYSFPSGHTLHAVAFTSVAVSYYPILAWLLVPFSLAVAASRVVLGLHYPSDVIAASVIGSVLAAASLQVVV